MVLWKESFTSKQIASGWLNHDSLWHGLKASFAHAQKTPVNDPFNFSNIQSALQYLAFWHLSFEHKINEQTTRYPDNWISKRRKDYSAEKEIFLQKWIP